MQFVIWGAGERGKRIAFHIGYDNVQAYIDADIKKIDTEVNGIKVIDFDTYLSNYREICILISTHEEDVEKQLLKNQIYHYLFMSECPEDFQSMNPRNILKRAIQKSVDPNRKYAVYGCTLYSIILYQWLLELKMVQDPILVFGENGSASIFEIVKREFGKNVFQKFPQEIEEIDKILITSDIDDKQINMIPGIAEKENVFYFSEKIEEYHNTKIKQYKNAQKGRRCFIIGTGPSLKKEDLEKLKINHELCISVNDIHLIFNQTNWRPDYYISTDFRQMENPQKREALNYMHQSVCFIADSSKLFCDMEHEENQIIYHLGKLWKTSGKIPFTEDFSRTVYNNGTVTYAAIELAVYLGCKEIYLLGVDASGINGNHEKYKHFFDEKVLDGTCFADQVRVSYLNAKRYADHHGIKLCNATRGGELEIFDRVNFDELF